MSGSSVKEKKLEGLIRVRIYVKSLNILEGPGTKFGLLCILWSRGSLYTGTYINLSVTFYSRTLDLGVHLLNLKLNVKLLLQKDFVFKFILSLNRL